MKEIYTKSKVFVLAVLFNASMTFNAAAQTCYSSSGCQDYSNFGYSSDSASNLEYDNYVSAFHQTVVRDIDGSLKIWGERTKADGNNSWLVPTSINAGNYPGLTGAPLKVAIGSSGVTQAQFVLLTSDNKLWAWGKEGFLIDDTLTSSTAFQQLSIGLPAGVTASNVKMFFGTNEAIILTTCGGDVYVLSPQSAMRGGGGSAAAWSHVEKQTGGFLTGIVAARGCTESAIALDASGNLWVWGESWNGTTAATTRNKAVALATPSGASGAIKMIGASYSAYTFLPSYYVLYTSGALYTLGNNDYGQLGNWNTVNQNTWIQPRYTSASGPVMNDIKWISPNEHDRGYAAINVLTSGKVIYNWGCESGNMIGRGSNNSGPSIVNPGQPGNFQTGYTNANVIAIESGGHTTMLLRECTSTFGYVGHRTEGSMGDNSTVDAYDPVYHFNTNAVQVCGSPTLTATLDASVNGPYCMGNTLQLIGAPSGGTYAIDPAGTATATLAGTNLTFNTAGTLRVNYTVSDGSACGTVTVVKVFAVENCGSKVTIPGTVWNDINGDAIVGGENGIANGLWVNLVGPNGSVIASARVNADGTYTFQVGTSYLAANGNYSIVVTNAAKVVGTPLSVADTPANGYGYTGVNRGGTTGVDNTNHTGKLIIGNLSTVTGGTTTNPVNFGIRLLAPVANNDNLTGQVQGTPATVPNILGNDIDPAGNILVADSITLVIPGSMPSGTHASATDAQGDITEITVPGEGAWELNANGSVTFTPEATFSGDPTPIQYSVTSATGVVSNIAQISIHYGTPLPVALLSFQARAQNNNVLLSWVTASEVNNRGFTIERSKDGTGWINIGFVGSLATGGNSAQPIEYSFTDVKPLNNNFYRLKQTDLDGKYVYSMVRQIAFGQNKVAISPNPASDYIIIDGLSDNERIKVYNGTGKLVREAKAVMNTVRVNLNGLSNGTYHVIIISGNGEVVSQKVMKL